MTFGRSVLVALLASGLASRGSAQSVDFNRDIRPILASHCFKCHGPDDAARKAGLRLDVRDLAIKELKDGKRAIIPGDAAKSELLARASSTDVDVAMPPVNSGKRLTQGEIELLRRWTQDGAKYAPHWSHIAPVRPLLPTVVDSSWPKTPVDFFILAGLEKEGLHPTTPADRYAIIRRLSIDLTGLPPTPEEADRFVQDSSADAYEKLVDRMLDSQAYGERWAQVWLDLARYADSQGYANDPDRTIWRWRDWLIQALNANKRYDQFTIEMLAGDLLPNPTTDQLIATGFHRNTLTNTEGGTNPEEFRSAAIVDRVNTTMAVWMGTTINCCQCHNHKYDPLTQKEFYQLYSIFNNTEDANAGNDAPTIPVAAIGHDQEFADLSARLNLLRPKLDAANREIEAAVSRSLPIVLGVMPPLGQKIVNKDGKLKERLVSAHRVGTPVAQLDAEVRELTQKFQSVSTSAPIFREGKPRPTHIHIRGNFLDLGDAVGPGLPAAFPSPPKDAPLNRLTLARWLVSPANPLTARVAVNRLWEELFGIGLVPTSEEFGMQGDPPSHPELLDWLATEYVRLGWDTKAMLKLLVTSATYRQSSQAGSDSLAKDSYNRLISRGPRVRLSAEEVRDQALFVSGLLSPKMFGPPVQPPKPNFGLSAAFGGTTDWQPSAGEDRYRRGVYTRVRRNAPFPSMTTFDAPERTSCTIRRLRTNTPLQALVTLNDPVYIECAQALARRIANHAGDTNARIAYAVRVTLIRPPTDNELRRLDELFEQSQRQYQKDAAEATAMATKPLGPAPTGANIVDLAAWTVVSNVLLNLDETLAKP